jgi:hypothetical protein
MMHGHRVINGDIANYSVPSLNTSIDIAYVRSQLQHRNPLTELKIAERILTLIMNPVRIHWKSMRVDNHE